MPKNTLSELGRFSDPSLLILSSLASGPKHGYAMMEDIFQFSGTRLEPGTLYGALARLEHRGWIEPLAAEDRRRPYHITATGMTALREQLSTMQRIVSTGLQRLPTT
jgi:DNA-binding PadR family transcriptional regulator